MNQALPKNKSQLVSDPQSNQTAGGSVAIPRKKPNSSGRPTVMTPEVIGKLEEVFALDGSINEACFYAGIHKDTYFNWIKQHPEYSDRFEALREKPVLLARQTVIKDLKTPSGAQWFLSRKRRAEFGGMDGGTQDRPASLNIYNFFNTPEIRQQVQAMEDNIKTLLLQPK